MMVNLLNCPQDRIPDFQNVLQHDPKTARDWLDNGVPSKRKPTRRERKAKKGSSVIVHSRSRTPPASAFKATRTVRPVADKADCNPSQSLTR